MAGAPHPPPLPPPVPPTPPDPVEPTGSLPVPPGAPYPVDQTVISQYANSPILLQLVANMIPYFSPNVRLNDFYNLVWNIDSAQGYGLDLWGRILGVGRVLHVPVPGAFLGFASSSDAETFGHGPFYNAAAVATTNFALSDDVYRRLLLGKALANISDGSIPSINQIMINLFPDYGNCYVIDNLDMTIVYRFTDTLSLPDSTIATQSGVLPKPAGVSATVHQGP